jgi:hypothetical protein
VLVVLLTLAARAPSGADPPDEAALFGQTAASRAQRRVGSLSRSSELDAVARRQAARMAAAPSPFHNPALPAELAAWVAFGEVVGRINAGPGWDARLQQMFLASPTHRQVVLSPNYTEVGIATVRTAAGVVNAVEVFGRRSGARPLPAPRASRQAAAPRPSAATMPSPAPAALPPPPPAEPAPTTTTTTTSPPLSRVALAGVASAPSSLQPEAAHRMLHTARATPAVPLKGVAVVTLLAALSGLGRVRRATRSTPTGRRRRAC